VGAGRIQAALIAALNRLGITTNGTYTAPSSGPWEEAGGVIAQGDTTHGVQIGGGTLSAAEILDVTGDATRKEVSIRGGTGAANSAGGQSRFAGGTGTGSGAGGTAIVAGGNGGETGGGGGVSVSAGNGGDTSGDGGDINIGGGGGGGDGAGGDVSITGGSANGTNKAGGNVAIAAGAHTGSGTTGRVTLTDGSGAKMLWGSGSPEGAVTAPIGSLYGRTDGGAGTSFYVKESGSGNTGWAAK
jgi:hypothetical protein